MPCPDNAPPSRPVTVAEATDRVLGAVEADESALTAEERRRADAHRDPGARRDFVAAHLLVRHGVGVLSGRPAHRVVLWQVCPDCGGRGHGRPLLPGLPGWRVSLAHGRGVVAVALGGTPVGVDVENARGFALGPVEQRMVDRVLTPAEAAAVRATPDPEAAFLRSWVRKEALVKAGAGTLRRLDALDLSRAGGEGGGARFGRWRLLDWSGAPEGSVGAAVAAGRAPVRIALDDLRAVARGSRVRSRNDRSMRKPRLGGGSHRTGVSESEANER